MAYQKSTLTTEQKQAWIESRKKSQEQVLSELQECQNALAHSFIVGKWVWIEFNGKPDNSVLSKIKKIGFTWNKDRKAWQHPCGVFTPRARRQDPRYTYGMERALDVLNNRNENEEMEIAA